MSKTKKIPAPMSDSFLKGYLECALWSSNDQSDDSGGDPLDKNYGVSDFATEALAKATKDCNAFIEKAGSLLEETKQSDMSQHGHDFWLTRNGHGTGFWDRNYIEKVGDELTEVAKNFRGCDAVIGDNGQIYLEGG